MMKMSKSCLRMPKSGMEVLKLFFIQYSSFVPNGRTGSDINALYWPPTDQIKLIRVELVGWGRIWQYSVLCMKKCSCV